jgi:hypothetical protein
MTDDRTTKRCRNAARWTKNGVFLCDYHKDRVVEYIEDISDVAYTSLMTTPQESE